MFAIWSDEAVVTSFILVKSGRCRSYGGSVIFKEFSPMIVFTEQMFVRINPSIKSSFTIIKQGQDLQWVFVLNERHERHSHVGMRKVLYTQSNLLVVCDGLFSSSSSKHASIILSVFSGLTAGSEISLRDR